MMQLFGTLTSPFVRRVRIVCLERGLPFSLVDTTTAEGGERLKKLSPIAKVPIAQFADGRVVFDSRVITAELCHDGWAPLRAPAGDIRGRVDEENVVNLVDEALLSLIRVFYLKKDGGDLTVPWVNKETTRARNILLHLNEQTMGHHLTVQGAKEGGLGRTELAAATALAWMRYRGMFDLAETPKLGVLLAHWAERPSFAQTAPP